MQLQDAERKRARLIASCIVFALISIPLILKIVPPNGIYGFRNTVTLSSKAICPEHILLLPARLPCL